VIAANTTNQHDFARALGRTPLVQMENGSTRDEEQPTRPRQAGEPLRILWSGEFEARKALGLLLKALARLPADVPWELRILGRGRLGPVWQRMAERLGISDRIDWAGWLRYEQVMQQYAWADLLAFTSLRDTMGTVVFEAMSMGVPVITLDHQGMRDLVTEQCGVKVPVMTRQQVVDDLAAGIERLARDEPQRLRLAAGAVARAHACHWSQLGRQMLEVYRRVLADSAPASAPVTPSVPVTETAL
jgi:glycosyltransferase involved in cell wall biosynthesis